MAQDPLCYSGSNRHHSFRAAVRYGAPHRTVVREIPHHGTVRGAVAYRSAELAASRYGGGPRSVPRCGKLGPGGCVGRSCEVGRNWLCLRPVWSVWPATWDGNRRVCGWLCRWRLRIGAYRVVVQGGTAVRGGIGRVCVPFGRGELQSGTEPALSAHYFRNAVRNGPFQRTVARNIPQSGTLTRM
ncbi:hypothetical protein B1526_1020 [Bifidobacterium criceti]|uniref:Uncharacterized protein n=1 Tax=Bifidobacterium criceti TaxID=1960969 RepID=A0A2A2EFI9_9BIFI|nr:hypothetical protein B1526_1020 [Bifidobacterium criceti]